MKWVSHESALLAWIGIFVFIFLYVLAYDLWAHFSGHLTMTAQFRNWLISPVAGPIVIGLWMGTFIGLCWHFFIHGK